DLHTALRNVVLGEQRLQQHDPRRLDADLLADHVLRRGHRFLLERKERVRVLLESRGKALDRDVLRYREHQRWAGRKLAALEPAGRDDRDAVDVGTARLDL